jgi:Rrf2 family protein
LGFQETPFAGECSYSGVNILMWFHSQRKVSLDTAPHPYLGVHGTNNGTTQVHFGTMQINCANDYAVRVIIHLATLPPGSKAQLIALEHATGVRGSFLSKVMQRLVHAGFVASHRGNGGGFCLRVDCDKTSLLEVVEAIEGPTHLNRCLADGASCERKSWCGVHPVWERAQGTLRDVLASVSIGQLSRDTEVSRSNHLQLIVPETSQQDQGTMEVAANKGKRSPV